MVLYIAILLVANIIAINDISNRRITISFGGRNLFRRKIMFSSMVLFVVLFLLTALRDRSIGNDTEAYIRIFNNAVSAGNFGGISSRIEVGFRYFCSIIKNFTNNPQVMIVTSAIICYVFTGIFIFSRSEYQGVMVAIFIPLMFKNFCSGMRQGIAFSLCLIAYIFIKKEKYYIGGFLILIAATFHITALVALFYYIIPIAMKNKRFKYTMIALTIIGAIVVRYSGVLIFFNTYGNYYEHYFNETGRANIGFLSCTLTMIVSICVFLSYIYIKKGTNKNNIKWDDDEEFWFGLVIILISVANYFSNNASRLTWYFELPFLVNMMNRTSEMDNSHRQKIVVLIILLYQFVFVISLILRPYYYSLIPYKFWGM